MRDPSWRAALEWAIVIAAVVAVFALVPFAP